MYPLTLRPFSHRATHRELKGNAGFQTVAWVIPYSVLEFNGNSMVELR